LHEAVNLPLKEQVLWKNYYQSNKPWVE
jgi:hypothetical protein